MKREDIAKMQKRSWRPFIYADTGKWYTGWDQGNYWERHRTVEESKYPHEVRTLKLTPVDTITGRSSANMIFKDPDGQSYLMTLKGGFELVKQLIAGTIKSEEVYLIADFVQVKKGANIFIEVVED